MLTRLARACLLGALLTLTACTRATLGSITVAVDNTSNYLNTNTPCTAGLQAKVSLSGTVIYEDMVPAGDVDRLGKGTNFIPEGYKLIRDGAPVLIEAECLDASGSIGSMRWVGELDAYSRGGGFLITPPDPPGYSCPADESEGRAPCFLDGPYKGRQP